MALFIILLVGVCEMNYEWKICRWAVGGRWENHRIYSPKLGEFTIWLSEKLGELPSCGHPPIGSVELISEEVYQ